MKTIGKFMFPDSPGDPWEPHVVCRSLAPSVLCVAETRVEGAWAAYCGSVPWDSPTQKESVLNCGTKLPEDVARVVFPRFEGVPYAR